MQLSVYMTANGYDEMQLSVYMTANGYDEHTPSLRTCTKHALTMQTLSCSNQWQCPHHMHIPYKPITLPHMIHG